MTALVVSTETGAESMGGRGSRGSGGQHQWICNPRIDNMSEKNLLFSVESFDRGCWYFQCHHLTLLTLDLLDSYEINLI